MDQRTDRSTDRTERDGESEPIKVTDRRSFTPEGERRSSTSEATSPEAPAAGEPAAEVHRGEGFEMRRETPDASEYPEIEFNSFILSLAQTAFIHLGEMEDPVTKKRRVDPAAARQIIDIIAMLQHKTQGNLDPREKELVEGILYELRMKYTQAV